MVLCSKVACIYFGLPISLALCICVLQISKTEGGSLKMLKKKKKNFVPMGFFSCMCYVLYVHKKIFKELIVYRLLVWC